MGMSLYRHAYVLERFLRLGHGPHNTLPRGYAYRLV